MEKKDLPLKKVVITGPESCGKTTLAKELAITLGIPYAREMAREFLNILPRPYHQADLTEIAKQQLYKESEIREITKEILLCDTDLLTIKIWSEYKYGNCDLWIVDQLHQNLPDLYLLCSDDIPWELDPQRENPENRDELFKIYQNEIHQLQIPLVIVNGNKAERLEAATRYLKPFHSS